MSPRLDALRRQHAELRAGIDAIEAAPAGDDGDLSPEQDAQVDTLVARADALRPEIEKLAAREKSINDTAAVLAGLGLHAPPAAEPIARSGDGLSYGKMPTAAEYFAAWFADRAGDPSQFAPIARALQTTADAGSVLPKPIVGELLNIIDASRPVFTSLTSRPMPDKGKTFERPRITGHVAVGEQTVEGEALTSAKMTLTSDPVTKRTIGGTLEISRQDEDWTDPAALGLVITDFADMYAVWTEGAACAALNTAIVATSPYNATDVGTIVQSYTAGVQAVYNASKRMPTTVWLSLAEALSLAAVMNTDDSVTAIEMIRKALQFVGVNLDFVVGPQLPAGTRIIGNKLRAESYERQLGLLTASQPNTLTNVLAYAGYIAFHIRPECAVKLAGA